MKIGFVNSQRVLLGDATKIEKANKAIRRVAEREQYDLILQDVVYFNRDIDITDKVIAELKGNDRDP